MFTPKWKKEAKLLEKAAKKFLNYKRDLLKSDKISEIDSRILDLRKAVKSKSKDATNEASKQLQATCENALERKQPTQGWIEENLEVIFVAIVVALGIRAYIIQPFRIPTGSMHPTLNGIVGTQVTPETKFPNAAVKLAQRATHGRSYVDLVLKETKRLRRGEYIEEKQVLNFFTRTYIHFEDGSKLSFPGPATSLHSLSFFASENQLPSHLSRYSLGQPGSEIKAGTVLARGYIDTGDLILVDKFSYHFRQPKRGEVFVFDTRDIKKIHQNAKDRGSIAGSHYIKRLAGIPGDELTLRKLEHTPYSAAAKGKLYINGELAKEPGFQKVMSDKDGYRSYGAMSRFTKNAPAFKARKSNIPGMNEYIALGDNSFNSSDSREWGTVKEFNLIGPAAFSLWPFMSGHWGFIK